MALRFLLLTLPAILLSACTIKQTIEPANVASDETICIIEDPDVREGFLNELTKVLREKQVRYTVMDKHAALDCEWTMTYLGRWTWDMALYMSYAEIKVYQNGRLDGEAIYDSSAGGFNFDKFVDAEPKIRELVEELMQ